MPEVRLDAADAAEARRNAAIPHRLAGPRPRPPGRSLEEFVGHFAYDISQLRQDLDRFVFLLGGSDGDGEPLFGP